MFILKNFVTAIFLFWCNKYEWYSSHFVSYRDEVAFLFTKLFMERVILIEISIFEGRTVETKKKLIRLLFEKIKNELNILPNDIEITIFETPNYNWVIRGLQGDEVSLNYNIKV